MPLKHGTLGRSLIVLALLPSASCRSQVPENRMVTFGPPEAEAEIRSALNIPGPMPSIDSLIRTADARGITHEAMLYDRSMSYCDVGRSVNDLNLETFFVRVDRVRHIAYDYLVVYDRDRKVVCIETRHSYPGL